MAPALAEPTPGLASGQRAGQGGRWRDLRLRVASASLLLPVVLLCLWFGGWPWNVLLALAACGLGWEWVTLCRRRPGGTPPVKLAFGVAYVAPACVALSWLRADPQVGLANVLFPLLVVWASDIGAYAAGRIFGGPRLAPHISPGKTWSGAAGGLACAMLVGAAASRLDLGTLGLSTLGLSTLGLSTGAWRAALVAAVLGVLAQLGDLLESGLKRHFQVKDSSGLIPGHGGLLDRLDGVLAAAPAAALLALALGRGIALWR